MLVLEKKDHIPLPPLVEVDSKSTWVTDLAVVKSSRADSRRSRDFQSQLATSRVAATLALIKSRRQKDKNLILKKKTSDKDNQGGMIHITF